MVMNTLDGEHLENDGLSHFMLFSIQFLFTLKKTLFFSVEVATQKTGDGQIGSGNSTSLNEYTAMSRESTFEYQSECQHEVTHTQNDGEFIVHKMKIQYENDWSK